MCAPDLVVSAGRRDPILKLVAFVFDVGGLPGLRRRLACFLPCEHGLAPDARCSEPSYGISLTAKLG